MAPDLPFATEPGVRYIVRGGDVLYSVGGVWRHYCLLRLWPKSRSARRIAGALGAPSSAARRQAAEMLREAE